MTPNPVAALFETLPGGPVMVHSDMLAVFRLVHPTGGRRGMLEAHLRLLGEAVGGRDLWFPTFNYDFTLRRHFSMAHDPSQVGPLSEHARVRHSTWRTQVPVFSFAGTGRSPHVPSGVLLDPFDEQSVFAELLRRDGVILWYGAPFGTTTLIHHVERLAGGPPYRYDKDFSGTVTPIDSSEAIPVTLRYHVRPLGRNLDYGWDRLLARLGESIQRAESSPKIMAISARRLVDPWLRELKQDPLYLLDETSRDWVEPELERKGRAFRLTDFEAQG